jgi:tetraacyldisaccharide 4'-kinase
MSHGRRRLDGSLSSLASRDGISVLAPCTSTPTSRAVPSMSGARRQYLALVRGEKRGPWPALQRLGLSAASLPYSLAVRLRNLAYDRGWLPTPRAGVPVVSVGNLTVGGTGKTPCVEYVARHYRARGLRVAVVSRGYGSESGRNDEALVLEENLPDVPHLQGADRVRWARAAVEELDSEILVLDDGFQHRRLARDLDLVLLDATDPWGGGRLLPRGLLREPVSGLRRAGVVLLTRCDQAGDLNRLRGEVRWIAPGLPIVETTHRPLDLIDSEETVTPLGSLRERPVAAFCGIGNPEAFRRTLLDLGADLRAFRVFADHHPYHRDDVEDLHRWAGDLSADGVVVTTQKDLVKVRLPRLGDRPLAALRVRLNVEAGQDVLHQQLDAVLPAVLGEM